MSSRGSSLPELPADKDSSHISHSGKLSPLSETLWRNNLKVVDTPDLDPAARLTWKDLWVTVTTPKGETQRLLHGLTGYAEPGAIMAIMGPSGSGKSTLLDSLAGRLAKNATLSGDILINGRRKTLTYGSAAYVTQQDDLIGTLTVRESVHYSANLRLPRNMKCRKDGNRREYHCGNGITRLRRHTSGELASSGLEWRREAACQHRPGDPHQTSSAVSGRANQWTRQVRL
ncbi:hypothetical protein Mapa_013485 [Marchantia paleacea]|nr:hypothetical protein Mapa_013485 [Marchantia paleacea]